MSVEERFDMERQYRDQETQSRWTGRREFEFCRECGRVDGMKAVHRDTLAEMPPPVLGWIKNQQLWWWREPGNSEYLFYPCTTCNPDRIIPASFVSVIDIQAWLDADSMAPGYAALAAEPEAATAGEDSRDSAGI